MDYPTFKYHPNAYELDIFAKETGICDIFGQKSKLKYNCSFYSTQDIDYICPFCIANGEASKKSNGQFNDYLGIESVIIHDNGEEFVPKKYKSTF